MEETIRLRVSKYLEIFNRIKELEDATKDNAERIKELDKAQIKAENLMQTREDE